MADTVTVINIIPHLSSGETNQDSEPNLAVNPANPDEIVATAFTPSPNLSTTKSPVFYSNDGGATWALIDIIPGTPVRDQTIRFATEINPHTIQVSIAAPYPGTELYRQAVEQGWLPEDADGADLVSEDGSQLAALSYPHLEHTEILDSVDAFYRRFYFRAGKIAEMSAEMFRRPEMAARRMREGAEFVRFLNRRARTPAAQ